jgi:hypothetical protein
VNFIGWFRLVPGWNMALGCPVPQVRPNVADDDLGDVGGQRHHNGRLLQQDIHATIDMIVVDSSWQELLAF